MDGKVLLEDFVRKFVSTNKQERFLYELSSKKHKGIDRLDHEMFTLIEKGQEKFKGSVNSIVTILNSKKSESCSQVYFIDHFHKEGLYMDFDSFISYFLDYDLAILAFIGEKTTIVKEENHSGDCAYIFEI